MTELAALEPLPGMERPMSTFDEVFKKTRSYGWYQLFVLVVIQWTCINLAGNFFLLVFAGLKPEISCNATDWMLNQTISLDDQCSMLAHCPPGHLQVRSSFYSIYEEFGELLCEYDWLPGVMATVQMAAGGVGEAVGGHLADRFGRKRVLYVGYMALSLLGILAGAAPSWRLLMPCIGTLGFFYGLQNSPMFAYASETVGQKYRIVQSCAFQWSIAFMIISLAAGVTRNWRNYAFVVNGVCIPLLGAMLLLVESPRWLIQKHRLVEAAASLNTMAWWNGRHTDIDKFTLEPITVGSVDRTYHMWHLFSNKRLALYSCVLIVTAISCETIPGVILFNVQDLAGSPFVNVALYGALRLWTPFFMVLLERHTEWFGRRALFICSQAAVSACFVAIISLYLTGVVTTDGTSQTVYLLRTALALLGAAVNVGMVWVVYKQYVTELYPTAMRATAVGAFAVCAVAGMGLAPQLVYMRKYWRALPYAAAALLSTCSLVLGALVLPETSAAPLPDSLHHHYDYVVDVDKEKLKPLAITPTQNGLPMICNDTSDETMIIDDMVHIPLTKFADKMEPHAV